MKLSQNQMNGIHWILLIWFACCYPNFVGRSEINGFEQWWMQEKELLVILLSWFTKKQCWWMIQGSFIKDEIIEDLGIPGRKLKLSWKTLTGKKSEATEAVDGLIISALDSEKGSPMEWPELPRACSKNCLPVEVEEIATPDKIKI